MEPFISKKTENGYELNCIKRDIKMYIDDKEGWRWAKSGEQMVLEDCVNNQIFLPFKVKSGHQTKKEMKQEIRQHVKESYNKNFDGYKKALLDFAIYLETSDKDYSEQDLDNVQKIVLDALQKDEDSSWNFLFENDAQICRILVWKSKKMKYTNKLVNWNDIQRNDNEIQKLKEFLELEKFLVEKLGYDWVETAEIEKIDNMTVKVSAKRHKSLELKLDNEKTKVTLKRYGKTYEFLTITESDGLGVYYDSGIDTVSTTISFRIHDPSKPMNMILPNPFGMN